MKTVIFLFGLVLVVAIIISTNGRSVAEAYPKATAKTNLTIIETFKKAIIECFIIACNKIKVSIRNSIYDISK